MPAFALKALATALTLAAALASAVFVGGHVRNTAAPLHPAAVSHVSAGGRLHLTPRVQTGDVEPVTSTYAS